MVSDHPNAGPNLHLVELPSLPLCGDWRPRARLGPRESTLSLFRPNIRSMRKDALARRSASKRILPLRTAARVLANRTAWPAGFAAPPTAKMCTYSLAKASGLRRRLSVPNPIPHLLLCDFLASRWKDLRAHRRASAISLSKPVRDRQRKRAVVPALPFEELPTVRATNRSNARYVVLTDLSEFYPSLYTHSVPWAIHGKATAKAQRGNPNLYGNKLDALLRMAQDQQTVGIPIGPDTSLVVAEIVLSAIDQELTKSVANIRGLRYSDDFELYSPDPSAAEGGIAALQQTLLEFELRLNPRNPDRDSGHGGYGAGEQEVSQRAGAGTRRRRSGPMNHAADAEGPRRADATRGATPSRKF